MIRPSQVLTLIVAGAVLVGAGVWLVYRPGTQRSLAAGGHVLPLRQEDLNAVTQLRIYKGDGSHTTLRRDATRWVVAEREYAADSGQVRKLLLDLAALQTEEEKTTDVALYPRLGVEDPSGVQAGSTGLEIDIHGSKIGLIVGKTSGTGSVYVRVAGQAQSLLANPQLAPDADPRHWLDRSILDIAPEQIIEMNVKPQAGPAYSLKRATAGAEYTVNPIPKGRQSADTSTLAAQAAVLAGLQLDDVHRAGSVAPVAQTTFRTVDGLVLGLAGFMEGEQRYITVVASADGAAAQQRVRDLNARLSGWQFELPGYRYDTLFRPLEQLLKPRPAAAPAAAHPPAASPRGAPAALPFGPQGPPAGGPATPQQSR